MGNLSFDLISFVVLLANEVDSEQLRCFVIFCYDGFVGNGFFFWMYSLNIPQFF